MDGQHQKVDRKRIWTVECRSWRFGEKSYPMLWRSRIPADDRWRMKLWFYYMPSILLWKLITKEIYLGYAWQHTDDLRWGTSSDKNGQDFKSDKMVLFKKLDFKVGKKCRSLSKVYPGWTLLPRLGTFFCLT